MAICWLSVGGGVMSLSAEYVRGFVDGEGSFQVVILKMSTVRVGWQIYLSFRVGLSKYRECFEVLRLLRKFFGVGKVIEGEKSVVYGVQDMKAIIGRIIPFFEKYPLIVKGRDFEIWSKIAKQIWFKRHLDRYGLKKYVIPLIEELYSLRKEKRPRKVLEELKRSVE